MIDAYIGIGSNLGDRIANVAAAVADLAELPGSQLVAVSHAYESEAWGVEHQDPYVNAVVHIRTELYADQLLTILKDAEERHGRERTVRFGPRTLDLDILLFGDEEWRSDSLTIPHPRMAQRDFVVRPLLEIAPEARYPNGDFVTDEAATLGKVTADLGPIPGWESHSVLAEEKRRPQYPPGAEPIGPPPEGAGSVPAGLRREMATGEQPLIGVDWVAVGESRIDHNASIADLVFFEAVLKDADIPVEFYPHRPNEAGYNPYGIPELIDIYVPASRLREALDLLAEVEKATPADE
jgi:2-amino-4-hydroxy-6-hydroxymethyldihydropteridine diphosphokinase